VLLDGKICPRS